MAAELVKVRGLSVSEVARNFRVSQQYVYRLLDPERAAADRARWAHSASGKEKKKGQKRRWYYSRGAVLQYCRKKRLEGFTEAEIDQILVARITHFRECLRVYQEVMVERLNR